MTSASIFSCDVTLKEIKQNSDDVTPSAKGNNTTNFPVGRPARQGPTFSTRGWASLYFIKIVLYFLT